MKRNGIAFSVRAAAAAWAFASGALAAAPAAETAVLRLSEPMVCQVVQRDERNQGLIPVKGNCSGPVSRIEARCEGAAAGASPSAWVRVCDAPTGGVFRGSLPAPAGGWYRVVVRALDGGREVARQSVEKVGVGEVFIMAGQSNAGNFGWPRQAPMEDRVATHCQWCDAWRHGYDPQPWAHGGTGGSPWPAMGDVLVRALDVPVALLPVAAGGTSVEQWLPAKNSCYPRLKKALDATGPRGARAILWHQGESDVALGTSADAYAERLGEVIRRSREDAGWEIPWGIATVSFIPEGSVPKEKKGQPDIGAAVREGQRKVCLGRAVFAGPTTDDLTGPQWRCDTIHLNGAGLREHGRRWGALVLKNLFPGSPPGPPSAAPRMSFSSPVPGFVAQRNAQGLGDVPVVGAFEGSLSRIEARWTPMKGGAPSPWIPVDEGPKDGNIAGTLRLPSGWYTIDIRGLRDGAEVVRKNVAGVGTGEVLVVAGGESVANVGAAPQTASDPRVSGYCTVCGESPLRDPLRGAIGKKGTCWPAMGDALAAALDVPVEIVAVGYSGSVAQWKPGTPLFHGGLLATLVYSRRFPNGGCRAVLWEVGELDAKLGTSADAYAADARSIGAAVRQAVRWEIPWVIAGTAFHPEASEANRAAVREGQRAACDGKTVLEGPSADDLTGPRWRYDGLHFTEDGLRERGRRWAEALLKLFSPASATGDGKAR